MGSGLRKNKYSQPLPNYTANSDEKKWYNFCVKNNIRISPHGILNEQQKWKIAIKTGPYVRGEKVNLSPAIYDKNTIWPEFYKMCKYYYEKYSS